MTRFLIKSVSKHNFLISEQISSQSTVLFDTETETKSGEVRDSFEVRVRSGNSNGYHLASGGERRRIDFCISLALQSLLASTGSKSNIFILDEPFESVDESGIGELVDLLREYSRKQGVAVYCISHLSNLKPLFDDVVTVRRENGVSQVEEMG